MSYNILAIDGGGLRGLITALLLQRLETARPGLLASFDLFAGTSTGGILALGLAAGKQPAEIISLYEQRGPKIFDDSIWDNIRDLGKTVGAEYDNKQLRTALRDVFGSLKLSALKKRVAICAFDLDNGAASDAERSWSPKVFHNYPGKDSDGAMLVADVALYTSSAPTYFPSAEGYVDGAVFANNPSMVGLAQALDPRNSLSQPVSLGDVNLFSVGTGVNLSYIKGDRLDWGYSQWIKPLINILMDGVSGISDFQCARMLGERYHRLQLVFPASETIALDAVDKMPRMRQLAQAADLKKSLAWIDKTRLPVPPKQT